MDIKGLNAMFSEFANKDAIIKKVRTALKAECQGKSESEIRAIVNTQINALNSHLNTIRGSNLGGGSYMPFNTQFFNGVDMKEVNELTRMLSDSTKKQFEALQFVLEYLQSVLIDPSKAISE